MTVIPMLLPLLLGAVTPDDASPSDPGDPSAPESPSGLPPGVPRPSPAPRPMPASADEYTATFDDHTVSYAEDPSLPRDHPAYDRVQARGDDERRSPAPLLWGGLVLLLMVAALGITYFLLRPEPGNGATPDLLSLAASHADAVELEMATDDLDLAQEYILSEFGWPVRVPVLPGARLLGVGVDAIADGIELPILQYQPEEGGPITVYLYDYAFLDAAEGRLHLAPAVYSRLAEDEPVDVRRVGETSLVLWRRRAAIYTAVMQGDPAPLVEYLRRH